MLGISVFLPAFLACLLVLYFRKQKQSSSSTYPPGPFGIPVIGGLWKTGFTLSQDSHRKLVAQYGSICSFPIGLHKAVVVSGSHAVKEILINHSTQIADRPSSPFMLRITKGNGVLLSNGHVWKQQRKLGLAVMRKLGKQTMERHAQEEAGQLVETIARAKGQPLNLSLIIRNSVANVIGALAFGHRFSLDDKEFLQLVEAANTILQSGATVFHLLYETMPWLMEHLPGPHKKTFAVCETMLAFARKEVEKHKNQQNLHEPQDFIDFYLLQVEKSKNDPTSTYNEENLLYYIGDLFVAGTDTTTTTMLWGLLLIASHPEIQANVHKEIDDVLGSSQSFSYQDLKRLPYTNAVIHEILRAHFILYFGLSRQCVTDVNVFGFLIPKGTYIFLDVESTFQDPEKWERPNEFYPNHFLDKEGNFVEKELFFPFGGGARVCLGEQLARIELFFLFTSLLREFTFQLPGGGKKDYHKIAFGFIATPAPYKICAVPRHSTT